jgi:hypothetical protein
VADAGALERGRRRGRLKLFGLALFERDFLQKFE